MKAKLDTLSNTGRKRLTSQTRSNGPNEHNEPDWDDQAIEPVFTDCAVRARHYQWSPILSYEPIVSGRSIQTIPMYQLSPNWSIELGMSDRPDSAGRALHYFFTLTKIYLYNYDIT